MRDAIIPTGMEHLHDHYHFAPAVRAGGLLFLSGQIGLIDGRALAEGLPAQIDHAWRNIGRVLEAAGCDYGAVVEITTFHVGPLSEHAPAFIEALSRTFTAPYPAWTAVEVSGLAVDGALVEVKVTALA